MEKKLNDILQDRTSKEIENALRISQKQSENISGRCAGKKIMM